MSTAGDKLVLMTAAGVAIGALVLVGIATAPEPKDDRSHAGSSRATTADGTRALFQYLERTGMRPINVEGADLAVPDGAVLALVACNVSEAEANALVKRVKDDGLHLFVATDDPTDPMLTALALPAEASGGSGRVRAAFPSPAVRGVERIEVESSARAQPAAGWVELLADDSGAAAAEKHFGAGDVIVLLDPSAVTNAGISRAQNLRFADAALRHLAGEGGTVAFDEYHHGYGEERTVVGWFSRAGFLPAFCLFGLALAVDGLRRHRSRLGPARPPPLPERRTAREFISGYAGLLRAAGHRNFAVRALERSLRLRLREDAGIPPGTPPVGVFQKLASRAPQAAARAYRALERAAELLGTRAARDRDLLELARDVRAAEQSLGRKPRDR